MYLSLITMTTENTNRLLKKDFYKIHDLLHKVLKIFHFCKERVYLSSCKVSLRAYLMYADVQL